MDLSQISQAIEGMANSVEEFRANNDRAMGELRERIEEIEARADRAGHGTGSSSKALAREHTKRFDNWIRKPFDSDAKNALGEIQSREGSR